MQTPADDERRNFQRIPFEAFAHLNAQHGEIHFNCAIIDISLNGILIEKPIGWIGKQDDIYTIDILLNNAQVVIKMTGAVVHIDQQSIGFSCNYIDLESITHLKRLIELNIGDNTLLERELSALIH